MQKVNCIVTYLETEKGTQILTMFATTRTGESICLLNNSIAYDKHTNTAKQATPYYYRTMEDIYSTVLNTLKANKMYTGYKYIFGRYFHNIDFVSLKDGVVYRYGSLKKR